MERILVLARHGQSEFNRLNLFTGWRDPDLTERGIAEARAAGQALKRAGHAFDVAFTSGLVRAQHTCALMLEEMGLAAIPVLRDGALNERDYGDLSGLNKDEARGRWGDAQVHQWRRSYDVRPPGGESLKDTAARVLPFYIEAILPRVMRGERVLVAAHGNSLRALVMVLDQLDSETVAALEIRTGEPLIYRLHADTTVAARSVLERDAAAA
ncbi:2,3-bisphosphoglycerate-dependent phosphoglycerate mutase [Methylobacterium sp. J-026]|uniref:2,3-bisphosphoglycerate-dependent phosphoglycerate mutase n=1 Tax=Methylobacterium sp. J-026 TaxID=2836624 RepID=UPI001FBB3AF9|nr:2,3-bisphosphoglycerate-dependent phosphoglycerate mutase [Methylobacterium sp. J-026]MCJ2133196.1 2,3-bisphosphoglycerate-dependent phosphoglycerate mutase [Methylobacterium sp. J-026]